MKEFCCFCETNSVETIKQKVGDHDWAKCRMCGAQWFLFKGVKE